MKRLALLLVLLTPATADAATLGRNGSELVYRSDPGQDDELYYQDFGFGIDFTGTGITPGPGCRATADQTVVCASKGVTRIRIVGGDGNDSFRFKASPPLIADLGPGDDELSGKHGVVTVSAGEGDDRVSLGAVAGIVNGGAGRDRIDVDMGFDGGGTLVRLEGGDGDDRVSLVGRGAGVSLSGGPGDDRLSVSDAVFMYRVNITCGPGADQLQISYVDRTHGGCAPHVEGVTPGTVSQTFREGRLSAAGTGSVTLRRRVRDHLTQRQLIARAPFDAQAGPLRVPLHTTPAGRRWLRRDPTLPLFVSIRTRKGEDRTVIRFWSRLG